ncbi:MAG: glycosyltransferase family 39 protein [Verrucomicrobiota bacterium]
MKPGETKPVTRAGCVVLLFCLAFLLRSCGLSQDLEQGFVYHPDAPKQIRKAEQIVDGIGYFRVGARDYDGYPYFNSYLAAYAFKAVRFVRERVLDHLGLPGAAPPKTLLLFWLTRVINVSLSSCVVLLIYAMARQVYTRRVACAAALLVALSPLDIVTPHFATGDATAAFFGILTVFLSLRVYRNGASLDYVLATVAAVCAFSTKYHAGMAGLSLVVAHLLRCRTPRSIFGWSSLGRGLLCLAVAVAAFYLTTPSMFINRKDTLRDIVSFLHYTSNFSLPPEVARGGLLQRLAFSVRENVPVLAQALSPWFFVAALAGLLVALFRTPEQKILAVLPVVYLAVGLTTKPQSLPTYHTLITPLLMLTGTAALASLYRSARWPSLSKTAAAALFALSALYLAGAAWREGFFFSHSDSRRMAQYWARQNIPDAFRMRTGRYTFSTEDRTHVPRPAPGAVLVSSSFRPRYVPRQTFFPLHTINLGDQSLGPFRNPVITFHVGGTDWISREHAMPTFQRLPAARAGSFLILDDEAAFYASGKLSWLSSAEVLDTFVDARTRLEDVLLVLRCGDMPSRVRLSFGGKRYDVALAAGETRILTVERPRRSLPLVPGRFLYKFSARANRGRVWTMLATTPLEKAVVSFNLGRHTEAARYFDGLPAASDSPTISWMRSASRRLAGADPSSVAASPAARKTLGAKDVKEMWGVSLDYLEALRYLRFVSADCSVAPVSAAVRGDLPAPRKRESAADQDGQVCVQTPAFMPEPGRYKAVVRLVSERCEPTTVNDLRLVLTDPGSRIIFDDLRRGTVTVPVGGSLDLEFPFAVSPDMTEVRVQCVVPRSHRALVTEIRILPDTLNTLKELRQLCDGAAAGAKPLGQTPPATSVNAWFGSGFRLRSFRIGSRQVPRGGTWPLHLQWNVRDTGSLLDLAAVWIHFVDRDGRVVLASGHDLRDNVSAASELDLSPPFFNSRVAVPADLASGTYTVVVGLHVPAQNRKIKATKSDLAVTDKGVVVGSVTVTD